MPNPDAKELLKALHCEIMRCRMHLEQLHSLELFLHESQKIKEERDYYANRLQDETQAQRNKLEHLLKHDIPEPKINPQKKLRNTANLPFCTNKYGSFVYNRATGELDAK